MTVYHENPSNPGILKPCKAKVGICPYAAQGGFHVETDDPSAAYDAYHAYAVPGGRPNAVQGVRILQPPARVNDPSWVQEMQTPSLSKAAVEMRQKAVGSMKRSLFGGRGRARRHGRLSGRSRGVTGLARRALGGALRSVTRIPGRMVGKAWNKLGRIPGAKPLVALGAFGLAGNILFMLI